MPRLCCDCGSVNHFCHTGGRELALIKMEMLVCGWRGCSTSGFICSAALCPEQQQLGYSGTEDFLI